VQTRIGDSFAVRGAGKTTQIIASGSGSGYFTVFTTADGTNFSAHQFALPPELALGEANRGLAFDGTQNALFAMNACSTTIHHIGFDLATETSVLLEDITLPKPVTGISLYETSGIRILPGVLDNGTDHRLVVYDFSNPAAPVIAEGGDVAFPAPATPDGNVTGCAAVGAGVVVALNTHNGVVALSYSVQTNSPSILAQPQDRTTYNGGTAAFTVRAAGSAPLRYQWYLGSNPIADATTSSLLLNSVQAANAGSYSVLTTNAAGSVKSAAATLSIATATGYPATILSANPLAYWRLGESAGKAFAVDSWGGHDGEYEGVATGLPGFSLRDSDTSAGFSPAGRGAVTITDGSSPVYTGGAPTFTLEAWAKFDDVNGVQRLFSNWQLTGASAGFGFGINGANGLRFTTFGVQDFDQDISGFGALQPGKWYHLVGVAEGGLFYFYVNGQQVGAIAFAGEALPATQPMMLGRNPQGNEVVNGQLDEAAIYNTALTPDQVLAHYNARYGLAQAPLIRAQPVSLTCYAGLDASFAVTAEGTEPLSYQWRKGGTDLPGETTDTLVLSTLDTTSAGDYSVRISNSAGTTTSATAHLTVWTAPAALDVSEGLVLHLKFDGDYLDFSGRGNHGTPMGAPSFVAGQVGSGALHYSKDTSSSIFNYVTLGVRPDLEFGSNVNFSVAFWVKLPAGAMPGDLPFFCNATNSSYNFGYTFSPSYNGGGWTWTLFNSDKTGPGVDGPDNSINDGSWHHLAYTFDRAGNGLAYLDGMQVDSRSIVTARNLDTGKPSTVGQDATGQYAETGEADLDDLGVWRRVLTPLEIAGIFTAGASNRASFVSMPVKLIAQQNGNRVQLRWSGGLLQSADEPGGAYKDVSDAASPYLVLPTAGKQFYRVRQ
jgi:hypothetical protein